MDILLRHGGGIKSVRPDIPPMIRDWRERRHFAMAHPTPSVPTLTPRRSVARFPEGNGFGTAIAAEDDLAGMAHDLGADLHQYFPQAGRRPRGTGNNEVRER